MRFKLIKALKNTVGRDISGAVVEMKDGTQHLVRFGDLQHFQARPAEFYIYPNSAEVPVYATDANGVPIGFILPNGSTQTFVVGEILTQQQVNALIQSALIAAGLITPTQNSVLTVSSVTVNEGQIANHTVTMALNIGGTFAYLFTLGTAISSDVNIPPSFSNGVTLVGSNVIIPNGVTSFTISFSTVQDLLVEGNETYIVSVGGIQGVGTIANDDFITPAVVNSVSSVSANEGLPIVHTVVMSNTSGGDFSYLFEHISTNATDINSTFVFSNGVTLQSPTLLRIPSGVNTFTITVNTIDDATIEGDETYRITVGGVVGIGTITNNDFAPPVTVTSITSPTVAEGGNLVYNVALSGASIGQTFSFATSGTATANSDYSTAFTFSNGVTLGSGLVTVPSGISAFTLTVATTDDLLVESDETLVVTIGGITGTGTITSSDVVATIASVSSPSAIEGANLVFTVTLSAQSLGQTFAYSFGGTATPTADYSQTLSFNNGVTASGGNITVPAGIATFTATATTNDDVTIEGNETVILTIGGVTGLGTIIDNDTVSLAPLTAIAVFEAPHGMLTVPQQTASDTSGGYPAFAVSRDSVNQASYAVYSSTTIGGTYSKILDNQAFTPSGLLVGTISYDHRTLSVVDEKDFPTVITSATIGMIADSAGQQEMVILNSFNTITIGGDPSKELENVGMAAMDSVPIAVGQDETARMFVLTTYGFDSSIKANGDIFYKIVPKDSANNELSLASVTPVKLTITSRASKPYPPKAIGFNFTTTQEYPNFPVFIEGEQLYIKFAPNSKAGGIYSYFNPASAFDAGVTVKVAVEGLNGVATPVRIITGDLGTGVATYNSRSSDGARYSTKYTIYSEKAGIKSNAFTYTIEQRPEAQNQVNTVALAQVSSTVEATVTLDGAGANGAELTVYHVELLGTLTASNINFSNITIPTANCEILNFTGTGNVFYVQVPKQQASFKLVIPYTSGIGQGLEVRVGKQDNYRFGNITIT